MILQHLIRLRIDSLARNLMIPACLIWQMITVFFKTHALSMTTSSAKSNNVWPDDPGMPDMPDDYVPPDDGEPGPFDDVFEDWPDEHVPPDDDEGWCLCEDDIDYDPEDWPDDPDMPDMPDDYVRPDDGEPLPFDDDFVPANVYGCKAEEPLAYALSDSDEAAGDNTESPPCEPKIPFNVLNDSPTPAKVLKLLSEPDEELKDITNLAEVFYNPPPLREELIQGVLRMSHKMVVTGASKAGKSVLLMELCVAFAEGITWLGFPCRKSRVLYVNLEIDDASCIHRFVEIYAGQGLKPTNLDNIYIWNLRGRAEPLQKLAPKLINVIQKIHADVTIIDPIYKVLMGDENSASDIGSFCNYFDDIISETECAIIYSHHHSKGAQGSKNAMDRASGSGVFARDPDAIFDMIEINCDNIDDPNITAWRCETTLREFPSAPTRNLFYSYPLHIVDTEGVLDDATYKSGGSYSGSGKKKPLKSKKAELDDAFSMCAADGKAKLSDMAGIMGKSEKTVRNYISDNSTYYAVKDSVITKINS